MKEKVLCIEKCVLCGTLTEYVMRDKNVNPMSDRDILFSINNRKTNPPSWQYCNKCELVTKQEIVAFDY